MNLPAFAGDRVEQRLSALQSQLHDMEYRLTKNLVERDGAWRERVAGAMSLLCRMLAHVVPDSSADRQRSEDISQLPEGLPRPDLDGRAITMDEYHAHTPEKFELLGGYLFSPAHYPEARQSLLSLVLVNVGLREAVRLAPPERWREALGQVYGSDEAVSGER